MGTVGGEGRGEDGEFGGRRHVTWMFALTGVFAWSLDCDIGDYFMLALD